MPKSKIKPAKHKPAHLQITILILFSMANDYTIKIAINH